MITKITGETPFQVLTNNFSISPSNEGYTLQISADGTNFSNLFSVGANVTRLVTGVAANSYYRLLGNQSAVQINWMKVCVTEGGGASGTELQPIEEFPLDAPAGTVIAYSGSSSAAGVYQYDGTEWVPVGVDDLSAYWTSAQTQSAITAVEDHLFDVEEVTASALTELHEGLLEVSARTVDLSAYWTSAQTEEHIESASSIVYASAASYTDQAVAGIDLSEYLTSADTQDFVTSADVKTQVEEYHYVTSAAIQHMVVSDDDSVLNIVKIEQSDYDTLVAQSETIPTTLYIVVPDNI